MTIVANDITQWPPGTVARYLTVVKAIVTLSEHAGWVRLPDVFTEHRAECSGCGDHETWSWRFNMAAHEEGRRQDPHVAELKAKGVKQGREWSQAHAERCRALPRPQTSQ